MINVSSSATPCDLLIRCRWCLPIVPANTTIEWAAIAVVGNRIAAVGPRASVEAAFVSAKTLDLDRHVVIPGLVNAHGHAAMTLLRGTAEDLALQQWLNQAVWPLEAAHVSREFVRIGTDLAMLEMLAAGITTFTDMYYFPDEVARGAAKAGVRAVIAFPIIDFPNVWSDSASDGLHKGLKLHDEYRDNNLVKAIFGPHAAYSVSRGVLEQVRTFAEELSLPVHIHLHENVGEVAEAHARVGKSWLYHLDDLGLLSPSLQAVHMTQLSGEELALVAKHNVNIIHCPHSNLKLASGICPVERLVEAGVNIALGTDGAASNNTLDLLAEARLAALLIKQTSGDATLGNAESMLRMATLGGARVLGLDDKIGSLEPDKLADMVAFDLGAARFAPVRNPGAALVHGNPSGAVSHVWVGGRRLYENGAFTSLDADAIVARANGFREIQA